MERFLTDPNEVSFEKASYVFKDKKLRGRTRRTLRGRQIKIVVTFFFVFLNGFGVTKIGEKKNKNLKMKNGRKIGVPKIGKKKNKNLKKKNGTKIGKNKTYLKKKNGMS